MPVELKIPVPTSELRNNSKKNYDIYELTQKGETVFRNIFV